MTAIKQDAEAIKAMPIVRSCVEDPVSALVRPECDRDRVAYVPDDFFRTKYLDPHRRRKEKLNECAAWLNGQRQKDSEVVVVVFADPKSKDLTSPGARTLTKNRRRRSPSTFGTGACIRWGVSRQVTPVGHGFDPSPVVEKDPFRPPGSSDSVRTAHLRAACRRVRLRTPSCRGMRPAAVPGPMSEPPAPPPTRTTVLYHYCRMQMPGVVLPIAGFRSHLARTYQLFAAKSAAGLTWDTYLDQLYVLDWYLCCGCLENDNRAWEVLFATRTGRSDCLLIDALRARAVRLYPGRGEAGGGRRRVLVPPACVRIARLGPVLARYDGQRPLAPWLIRVFQNWHVSQLRSHAGAQALPEDDVALPIPEKSDVRWHDAFARPREWLGTLTEQEVLLLGLRWRYRLSQREISHLFGVHEGTISRQTDKLRDRCLAVIGKQLTSQGWTEKTWRGSS